MTSPPRELRSAAHTFDEGVESVWNEIVCSVCGRNHDRDESAACPGCEPVPFVEWFQHVSRRLIAEAWRGR